MFNIGNYASISRSELVPLTLIRYLWALCNLSYLTGDTGCLIDLAEGQGPERQVSICHEPEIKPGAVLMKLSAIRH